MNVLEKVNINNSEQWILVRVKDDNSPLILHVQAGPGMLMICEANKMQRLFNFEKDFTVAYWDQRACGKSYNKQIAPSTINFAQLTDDLIQCSKYLKKKYNKEKIVLIGYSLGATISLMAATKNRELFSQLFLVSTDIDLPKANQYAIDFAIKKAKVKHNFKLLKQAKALRDIEISTEKLFQQRAKILSNAGGMMINKNYTDILLSTIYNLLSNKAYCLSDILKTIKGMNFCQSALLGELNKLNMFEKIIQADCSIHFLHGLQSGISSYEVAKEYYDYLVAADKTFTTFENSAHLLHYDEPKKFATIIYESIIK